MKTSVQSIPLGVILTARTEYLFFRVNKNNSTYIHLVKSSPYKLGYNVVEKDVAVDEEKILEECRDFRFGKLRNGYYFLTYKVTTKDHTILKGALSRDLIKWKNQVDLDFTHGEVGVLLSNYKYNGKYVMYFGEKNIKIAYSKDLNKWSAKEKGVLWKREGYFDSSCLKVIRPLLLDEGIMLLYFVENPPSVGVVIYSKDSPDKLVWRSDVPVWEGTENLNPIGAVVYGEKLILYFSNNLFEIKEIVLPLRQILKRRYTESFYFKRWELVLEKFEKNPIIAPIRDHPWESQATFNTAAVYNEDEVHFIYRAIGESNMSVLGYASSKDGVSIDKRLDKPVYTPRKAFEYLGPKPLKFASSFVSGPGYGGCEDPRITKIGNRFYMTYVAFNGFSHPRVALTSIDEDDFHEHNWDWEKPVLISPPGVVDKNAVIFPEPINGKYVIFHRVFPNILIDFVDNLNFNGNTFLKGEYMIQPREEYWDSRKVGAGAPPIKTQDGWLLIYHAVDDRDSAKYKIGAMLLDLEDPRKVLFRTRQPIIEPTNWYENEGYKSGVAYPCGAVVLDDKLFVYYGGADTVVCVASADLQEFLDQLKYSQLATIDPIGGPSSFVYHA